MKNKNVRAYALPGNERCTVRLLDTYLAMLPPDCANFYMRPLEKSRSGSKKCAVTKQRVGINVLKSILSELSEKSGVGVHYTNHSLRATAKTDELRLTCETTRPDVICIVETWLVK